MKAAFDQVAAGYDDAFTNTEVGFYQRRRVWNYLEKRLSLKGRRILELNCGTGEDALWLARKGARILATDISPEMVAMAHEKIENKQYQNSVQCQVAAIQSLADIHEKDFDLIFSNFGGMNCLSADEIKKASQHLANKLRDNGDLIVVIMPSFCLWESLYFLLKMKIKTAFRRWSSKPIPARLDAHTTIDTWYYSPFRFRSFFSDHFQLEAVLPVGLLVPPSYLNGTFVKYPKILSTLMKIEDLIGTSLVLSSLSDHCLIHLKKKEQ